MESEFEKFFKWTELNKIELYEYQKKFIKDFFESKKAIIPRENGRSHGV